MGLFSSKSDWKIEQLEKNLRSSFERVRHDNDLTNQWIHWLGQENSRLQNHIFELQNDLRKMPSTSSEVRKIIDAHYSFEPILERIRSIENRINDLRGLKSRVSDFEAATSELKEKVENLKSTPAPKVQIISREPERVQKTKIREKIVKRLTRNSKTYTKDLIFSLVEKYGKMSGPQLKEMIVDEQGLCSKSSFYRLVEELETDGRLSVVIDGKEKVYFPKSRAGGIENRF